jgi:hypothetical protein
MQPLSLKSGRPFWPAAAAAMLAALAAHNVWRAMTAAVTIDEAFSANDFAGVPWGKLFLSYDANHHVLHSILCKLSFTSFGISEISLRLPGLIAGIVCLGALFVLARRMFGDTPLLFIAACGTAFHPVLVDFFSLARGYGLAAMFLVLALIPLSRLAVLDDDVTPRAALAASLCLGLSVASNLVFAVPAAAVILAAALARGEWRLFESLAAPGAVAAFLVLALPLSRADASYYYYGEKNALQSARTVLEVPGWDRLNAASPWIAAGLVALALVLSVRERKLRLLSWTLALSLAAIGAMKVFAHVPLPRGRTGLYLLPLLFFLAAQLMERAAPWIRVPAAAFAALLPFVFLSTLPGAVFREWEFDRANRRIFAELARRTQGIKNPVVDASWPLNFGLEFYRRASGTQSFGRIKELLPGSQADVFVITAAESAERRPSEVEVLYRDPETGTAIAVRRY